MKIYRENLFNLTLIDLPGMTYKQSKGVEFSALIKEVINEHIQDPNCLILLVNAANNDFNSSETVQMAWNVDELKSRTIQIVTKADLAGVNFGASF